MEYAHGIAGVGACWLLLQLVLLQLVLLRPFLV